MSDLASLLGQGLGSSGQKQDLGNHLIGNLLEASMATETLWAITVGHRSLIGQELSLCAFCPGAGSLTFDLYFQTFLSGNRNLWPLHL